MKIKLNERQEKLLRDVVEHFEDEDKSVRQMQMARWRQFKLLWDNFTQIYYDSVAHDWRIWHLENESEDQDQSYYDKPVNIFKAYLESIIAALSASVPAIKCIPEDAENALDLSTAKAGDRIAQLIYKHNAIDLKFLHALFVYVTEGMTAAYTYSERDEKYGTYKENKYEEKIENHAITTCPECGSNLSDEIVDDNTMAPPDSVYCENCDAEVIPEFATEQREVTRITEVVEHAKSRQCLDIYGGLFVKVPTWARSQKDCTYLNFDYETHFSNARAMYADDKEKRNKIQPGTSNTDEYGRWARLPNSYNGTMPQNTVTVRNRWLRPQAFEILEFEDARELKKLFPSGVKAVFINDIFCEAIKQNLDECWTLTYNPLSDSIHFEPVASTLVPLQEITNDLMALFLQLLEHGVPQTFADQHVLDFDLYSKSNVTPGAIYPVNGRAGRSLQESFHEVRTATFPAEGLPIANLVQSYAQLTSGALPSLFGGELEGSKTASEYSMSRTQALQRQQNTWKIIKEWWRLTMDKMIKKFMDEMQDDEKLVKQNSEGRFINVIIRKADTLGTIGSIELEAAENLPMTWMQRKDAISQLIQLNNPQILQYLFSPQNLPIIQDAIGLTGLVIPDEEDRNAEYEEIQLLLNSEPEIEPVDQQTQIMQMSQGQPVQTEIERPSIEINPELDNHTVRFEIGRVWLISEEGRLAKITNELGYRNVLLHTLQHFQQYQMLQQQQQLQQQANAEPTNRQQETMNA